MFTTISNGGFVINGFDSKMLRWKIFKEPDSKRNIDRTTRLIAKLRAHKLIKKVPKKNRYYLIARGRKITNSILLYINKELLNAA